MNDAFINSFEHIFFGLDFGWYPDPAHFTGVAVDISRRNIYIFREFRSTKLPNRQLFDKLYNELKYVRPDDIVTCDSAEPKSISDLKSYGGYGCRGAKKGPDSLDYSMKWLQSLRHIYIDPKRCPATYKEFIEYEYERDKEDEVISGYPDKNDHAIAACRYALERYYSRRGQ